ncbi:hypothetical protein WR25_05689 [Diploscapter pachys]|uniref:Uncharacterized protein n=1 Tax=Diploscapter pachys TaxID=2018661 RepID=A0A2A2K2G1_9BILA|nr:hypothetical protein WR25_05689 [Diploscapter pachys]
MPPLRMDFEPGLDPASARMGCQPDGIRQQDFLIARLDQHGGKTGQRGPQRSAGGIVGGQAIPAQRLSQPSAPDHRIGDTGVGARHRSRQARIGHRRQQRQACGKVFPVVTQRQGERQCECTPG